MLKQSISKEDNAPQTGRMNWLIIVISFAAVGAIFTIVGYYATPTNAIPKRPNIIFILVDDLGWNDVSFHGSAQIPTPNLDALGASGIILNNYYSHPQCTPSRGALLTGKYANRIGLQHFVLRPTEPAGLPLDVITLPQYLKDFGYVNHMIGKWHLGYHRMEYLPTRRGFDSFFGNLNDYLDYYDYTVYSDEKPLPTIKKRKPLADSHVDEYIHDNSSFEATTGKLVKLLPMFGMDLWENEELMTGNRGEYITELYAKRTVDVILKHNDTQPLFLFVSFTACQVGNEYFPLQAPPDQIEKHSHIKDLRRRTYAGVVSSVDDAVGKIFKALAAKGMLHNSVIVVSSDNGGSANGFKGSVGSNWPLRGMKYDLWEGGVKATALIWSPLLQLQEPKVSQKLFHITDWVPTFHKLAGGKTTDFIDVDGFDIWPALIDESIDSPRKEILLNIDPVFKMAGYRRGDMKLITGSYPLANNGWYGPTGEEDGNLTESMDSWAWKNGSSVRDILIKMGKWLLKGNDTWRMAASLDCGVNFLPETGKCDFSIGPCLYNITDDPCEFRNIAAINPGIVQSMLARIVELNATSIDPVNTDLDPKGDPRCRNFAYEPWLDDEDIESCPWV